VGATFDATFNQGSTDPLAPELHQTARVLALSDGHFLGRRGLLKGSAQSMGPSALLALGGVQVAVISQRQQLLDPAQLEVLGINLDHASSDASKDATKDSSTRVRTLVAKSRGHFRAAFDTFTSPERILEVDCPGLTTPKLSTLPWTRMPRPVYPLDTDTPWQPPADPRDGLA
jgi:microcystin degradation protein MlrC